MAKTPVETDQLQNVSIVIAVSNEEFDSYVKLAYRYGFLRLDPRAKWTVKEYKEAVRYVHRAWHTNLTEKQ